MPRDGATTLSDLITPTLTLVCKPCDRNGVYNVKSLVAKHGDARLTDLRAFLTANGREARQLQADGPASGRL